MKELEYFTFAKADGKKTKFRDPVDYWLEFKDEMLTLHFFLPLEAPAKAVNLNLEVFDPEFFIDFELAESDPVKLAGAPSACKLAITRRPDPSAPLLSQRLSGGDVQTASQLRRDVREQDRGQLSVTSRGSGEHARADFDGWYRDRSTGARAPAHLGEPRMTSNRQVGVIGLGLLGSAIAERLVAAWFRLNGFDIDPATQAAFERRGGIFRAVARRNRDALRSARPCRLQHRASRSARRMRDFTR